MRRRSQRIDSEAAHQINPDVAINAQPNSCERVFDT